MSELAEGARLEIACAAKSGTEGSNPSLSANFIALSRRQQQTLTNQQCLISYLPENIGHKRLKKL